MRIFECLFDPQLCGIYDGCEFITVWRQAQESLVRVLKSWTIADFVRPRVEKDQPVPVGTIGVAGSGKA